MIAGILENQLIIAGLPVIGIGIGQIDNKSTWRVDWIGTPTPLMLTQAQAIIDAFDPGSIVAPKSEHDKLVGLLILKGLITRAELDAQ
jgi:hypothetical protein